MISMSAKHYGPLFLVGMPRSGTKLLRAVLNEHPGVAICDNETEFLPAWVSQWSSFGDLSSESRFHRFYEKMLCLPFFVYEQDRGSPVDKSAWFANCKFYTTAGVFEGLMRTKLGLAPADDSIIWGDKSPSYISHIPLLRKLYPSAKVIHIVRDVRDYCLSIENAWGKNTLRSAQRWADDTRCAHEEIVNLLTDGMEVRYEDLLNKPYDAVQRICMFLGIQFYERMITFSHSTENLGAAKGRSGILRSNTGKYQDKMAPCMQRRIEEIAYETMHLFAYSPEYATHEKRLGRYRMRLYQFLDGIALLRFGAKERGLLGALNFYWQYFRSSGNQFMSKEGRPIRRY